MRKLTIPLTLVAVFITGCGGGSHKQQHAFYKSTPRPALAPGEKAPNCSSGTNHSLGQCLPKPIALPKRPAQLPSGIGCIDLSNNNPVYGVSAWRQIAARGIRCAYFKVNESTSFIDSTAARMASDAKAAGIAVGGYDYQHICLVSAVAEARVFVARERADGLIGRGTLPGAADAEFGNRFCNARVWETAWRSEVGRDLGRSTVIYTGAWFWNPVFGSFWPSDAVAWISGYNVSRPSMPSGRSHLDLWQWTDKGFNGVSSSDTSVWLNGTAAFAAFASTAPPPPPRIHCFGPHARRYNPVCEKLRPRVSHWSQARDSTLRALHSLHCAGNPPRSPHTFAQVEAYLRTVRHSVICAKFDQRGDWFAQRVHQNLY